MAGHLASAARIFYTAAATLTVFATTIRFQARLPMTDFAIIGAGISGLSTAWFLREQGFSVHVFEASDRVGGSIRSQDGEGYLVEAGPNSTLENTSALGDLVAGVGLERQLREANPQAKRRYILKYGELHALPGGPVQFLKTPLFSPAGKLRLLGEPFIGRPARGGRRGDCEETIAEFVRRRLGNEFLDWAIDPFISGVYAGDPEKLSVQAATRKIYALEDEYRSLFIGAIRRMIAGRRSGPAPAGRLINFSDGMETFPRAIAESLGEAVETRARIEALRQEGGAWRLRSGNRADEFAADQVVLAAPAQHCAELLEPLLPQAAEELRGIDYPPVASVALGFPRDRVAHPLDGFGFLIPRKERLETLGALFSSTLFPGRAPRGQVLLTCFIGGARNPGVARLHEDAIVTQVLKDIAPVLGIQGAPSFQQVNLWPHAIPQYSLGHNQRIGRIEHAFARLGGLHARGNWSGGISLSDCVRNARDFAARIAAGGPR